MKYNEYFDVDSSYFPCIDEEAINAGVDWKKTYPHDTFVKLLKESVNMLDGATKRSMWIYGAYGTGKSQCALALRKIFDPGTSDGDVVEYWNRYEPLRTNNNLLEKILGLREKKVVTVFKYAVSSINSINAFFSDIQESISTALKGNGYSYLGENTLRDSAIKWIEAPHNKEYLNAHLNDKKWRTLFTESSADEILSELKSDSDVTLLMNNLEQLASELEIRALKLGLEDLVAWIKDVVERNHIKILFVWDEFSDFFKRYRDYMSEFQKVVSVCESTPFYFVIVTHSLTGIDEASKIVRQRFTSVEITLPESIAFDLIGHAFSVKQEAEAQWRSKVNEYMDLLTKSTKAITDTIGVKKDIIGMILPIHPMAALVLNNISSAFQSNQRSMFDFIKLSSPSRDDRAFQWFIREHGTEDETDDLLLTVDMLWDFFYEKGKQYLSSDIKLILDAYTSQIALNRGEERVLKTILILQAISKRSNGVKILAPTDQNLSYAFEGLSYETTAKNIAKTLVKKGILFVRPGVAGDEYSVAVLAGDNDKIEKYKEEIKHNLTTLNLLSEGDQVSQSLDLSPALKLRYSINEDTGAVHVATLSSFAKLIEGIKDKPYTWNFCCVLAVAKDDVEAGDFRTLIRTSVTKDEYKKIIIIDALSSPLGVDNIDDYVNFSAMSKYYHNNDRQQEMENSKKAKEVLNVRWRKKIHDGQFYIFTTDDPDGLYRSSVNEVLAFLKDNVISCFPNVLDFNSGLNQNQLKASQIKQSAKFGVEVGEVKGVVKGCEISVLGPVWGTKNYWDNANLANHPVVKIKKGIDNYIKEEFTKSGKVEIGDVYTHLQKEYGFSPCNMSAFVFGFLLKEYSLDPFRFMNYDGRTERMTSDKIAEMIFSCMGKNHRDMCIVQMTQQERDFYQASQRVWDISATECTSPREVSSLICNKIKGLGYPVWCLIDYNINTSEFLERYIQLIQTSSAQDEYSIAMAIGQMAVNRPSFVTELHDILVDEKCREAMNQFLEGYNEGKLLKLAEDIGAKDLLYTDIKKIFSIQYMALWNKKIGLDEIDSLSIRYDVIKNFNEILGISRSKIEDIYIAWREKVKFMGLSSDGLKEIRPELENALSFLCLIAKNNEILKDRMPEFDSELIKHNEELKMIVRDSLSAFKELYRECLVDFSEDEIEEIRSSIQENLFIMTKTQSFSRVVNAAEKYRSGQIKIRLKEMWSKLTGSKNPRDWSMSHRTPILCLIDASIYEDAKNAFGTLNSSSQSTNVSESDISSALGFLDRNSDLFTKMKDQNYIDDCFKNKIIGAYSMILTDLNLLRDNLEKLGIDTYSWSDNPTIKALIRELAQTEYSNGGAKNIQKEIDALSDSELKEMIQELVSNDLEFGLEIIKNRGKK